MRDLQASLAAAGRQRAEGCVKIDEDLARYRVVLDRVRPDVIVECGTFSGRSACWFHENAGCPVVTIDLCDQVDAETLRRAGAGVAFLRGDSVAIGTVAQVLARVESCERPMVVLDSDHSAAHVYGEILAYAPLVAIGSYLVVEDGLLRWMDEEERRHYRGNPLDAIEQFLAGPGAGSFEVDELLEDLYPITQHPKGWLRRVR